MSDTRIVFLTPHGDSASPYIRVDEDGEIVARGRLVRGDEAPPMRTILVVPGEAVLARWVALPNCTPAQAVAAAAHLLKDEIAAPRDSAHIAVGPSEENGFRLVCAIARSDMQAFLARGRALGLSPEFVVPDHLMLPTSDSETILATLRGGMVVARGRQLAFSLEPDLAWLLIGKRAMQPVEKAGDVESLFAANAAAPWINLLQGEFAGRDGQRSIVGEFRRAAVLAAAVLLSPLILWGAEITHSEIAANALETRSEVLARGLPGAGDSTDPVLYVKGRLADLRESDRFLGATAILFDAVQRINGAELESLSYLNEGVIRATLITAEPSDLSGLRENLAQAHIALEQDAPSRRAGRSVTTITIKPSP